MIKRVNCQISSLSIFIENAVFYLGICQGISFTLPLARFLTCSYNSTREKANGPNFGLNIPWLLPQSLNKDFYISAFGKA